MQLVCARFCESKGSTTRWSMAHGKQGYSYVLRRNRLTRTIALSIFLFGLAAPGYAAGTGMPWEQPLQQVLDSITGPVARAAAVIAIVISGCGIMFSEGGGGVRK